jgi:hypothetical protein
MPLDLEADVSIHYSSKIEAIKLLCRPSRVRVAVPIVSADNDVDVAGADLRGVAKPSFHIILSNPYE